MRIHLRDMPNDFLFAALQAVHACDLHGALERARTFAPHNKKEVKPHQAALLHILAKEVPHGGSILEIGTNRGYSAAVMALASSARITTLEANPELAARARWQLAPLKNVHVLNMRSQDYLRLPLDAGVFDPPYFDLVFVDGDHNRIAEDLPWFNRVKVGGLFLCDDYSPAHAANPSGVVFQVLNEFAQHLGREPDILMVDAGLNGMCGWYRKEGEVV